MAGAKLTGANLAGVTLSGADLSGADLSGQDLSARDLSWVIFTGANLNGVKRFMNSDLSYANLSGLDLSGKFFNYANFTSTNLAGADLTGANLSNVIWDNTTCPDGSKTNTGCSSTVVQALVGTGSPVTTKAEDDATFEQMMRLQEETFRSYEEILRL